MGDLGFLAAQLHPHLAARGARQDAGDDLEIQSLATVAEAAADMGFDDPYSRRIHGQALGRVQVHVIGNLGTGMER